MKKYYKYLTLIPLVAILLVYTQCVPTNGKKKSSLKYSDSSSSSSSSAFDSNSSGVVNDDSDDSSGTVTGMGLSSVDAFAQTTHKITTKNCALCHASLQQPFHANPTASVAHDAIMAGAKVNLSNPAQSRLVLKLQAGHNCWGNCASNAAEMLDSINNWVDLMKAPDAPADTGTTTNNGLVTSESVTVAEALDPNQLKDAGSYLINLESAMLQSPMVKVTSGDSSYIWVPAGTHGNTQSNTSTAAGRAYSQVSLTQTTGYKIFGYVDGPNANDDSFHIRVGASGFVEWHTGGTTGFQWVEVTSGSGRASKTFNLTSGNQQIEIREREDGAKISYLYITNDLQTVASDISGGAMATLSYSLDALAPGSNAYLKVNISNYDNYSYKLSKPRIVLPRGTLKVKSLKPLINGSWNAQHSTYTLVDKTVSPSMGDLSSSSMIILKDRGDDVDQISFEFGEIEYRP